MPRLSHQRPLPRAPGNVWGEGSRVRPPGLGAVTPPSDSGGAVRAPQLPRRGRVGACPPAPLTRAIPSGGLPGERAGSAALREGGEASGQFIGRGIPHNRPQPPPAQRRERLTPGARAGQSERCARDERSLRWPHPWCGMTSNSRWMESRRWQQRARAIREGRHRGGQQGGARPAAERVSNGRVSRPFRGCPGRAGLAVHKGVFSWRNSEVVFFFFFLSLSPFPPSPTERGCGPRAPHCACAGYETSPLPPFSAHAPFPWRSSTPAT